MRRDQLIEYIAELQSLAQAGLHYGKDKYDLERYQRIRDITAEMMALRTELPLHIVQDLFCGDSGYQTPKIDTRAAVFKEGKILLVQEEDGLWSLPGGWCDVNVSPMENTIKETKEEAGIDIQVHSVIAIQDRAKHNHPEYVYGIVKIFYLCEPLDGHFEENLETIASGYFTLDELPPLSEDKVTAKQIEMCFEAKRAEHWKVQFD